VLCAGSNIEGFQSTLQGDELNLDDVAASNAAMGERFHVVNTLPQVMWLFYPRQSDGCQRRTQPKEKIYKFELSCYT